MIGMLGSALGGLSGLINVPGSIASVGATAGMNSTYEGFANHIQTYSMVKGIENMAKGAINGVTNASINTMNNISGKAANWSIN